MYIKLYKGFLAPTNLHGKKVKETEKIENKLRALGFVLNGSNFAKYECVSISELGKMFQQLTKLGIVGAEVSWA